MAIISTENDKDPFEASAASAATALQKAAEVAAFSSKVLSGDVSAFLVPSATGFEGDITFSSLIKAIDLPEFGFQMSYSDLGWVRYPHAEQVLTMPLQLDFIETDTNLVAKYFHNWLNIISPVVSKINTRFEAGKDSASTISKGTTQAAATFKPLASAARVLYVIKMKRDTALSLLNYLADMSNKSALGNFLKISTGFYEAPVQIYCFPKVVPQKFKESKLDKGETNTIRTVAVTLERVPTIRYPTEQAGPASTMQVFMSGVMGYSGAVSAITDSVIGIAGGINGVIGKLTQFSKLMPQAEAKVLVDTSRQTESYTEPEET